MNTLAHTYCSFCGVRFETLEWPRRCGHCSGVAYRNPVPVAVGVVACSEGLLLIRRGISPAKGKWALPGGFIDFGESWQQATSRELTEEVGLQTTASDFDLFKVKTASNSNVLIFGTATLPEEELLRCVREFKPNTEVLEVGFFKTLPEDMAFPSHAQVVQEYLWTCTW